VAATAGKPGAELAQCRNLKGDAQRKGTIAAAARRRLEAAAAYRHLEEMMRRLRDDGCSFRAITDRLNDLGHRTCGACPFNCGQAKRIPDRTRTAGYPARPGHPPPIPRRTGPNRPSDPAQGPSSLESGSRHRDIPPRWTA
jgi:hypothetical protein